MKTCLFAIFTLVWLSPATAGDAVRVAVASNFAAVLDQLAESFEHSSGHSLTLSSGSTGKLFAQIQNGAAFDVFFAADEERPRLLEQSGQAVDGSRFTYALGRLMLWVPGLEQGSDCQRVLKTEMKGHFAIANPRLAPYGRAAQEVLTGRSQWSLPQQPLVYGENIGQTFAFIHSGAAEAGLIAKAQSQHVTTGCLWAVPAHWHAPIAQQAVLLRDSSAARALMEHMSSESVRSLIAQNGYDLP